MLSFCDLDFTYPYASRPTLAGISLAVAPRQKTVLLGHNGSGKSTLFLLADGLLKPTRGAVCWDGEPLRYHRRSLRTWRRRVGLAFQDPDRQLVAATVAEDISYGLCNLPLSAAEVAERRDRTLTEFDLTGLAHTPLQQLSLGQKRRVALAGVMALEPEVLLLDEPTAYLDRPQLAGLRRNLDRLEKQGVTLVMATHDLDFAYAWGDRICVLHEGKLVLDGSPEAVFTQAQASPQLQLGTPTVWELWQSLCPQMRPVPHTIEEIKQQLQARM